MRIIVLVAVLGALSCGDDDPCESYCSTVCNKAAFCDAQELDIVATDAEVAQCTSDCVTTVRQGIAGGSIAGEEVCSETEPTIEPLTCEEFASLF